VIRINRVFPLVLLALWQAPVVADFNTFMITGVPAPDGNGNLSLPNAPAINSSGQMSFVAIWSAISIDGDYDGDNDVDGRDFLTWQRGDSFNPLSSADLQSWQENYDGGTLAVVIIPEPPARATICIFLMLAVTGLAPTCGVARWHGTPPSV
jgi:hypothetical protein